MDVKVESKNSLEKEFNSLCDNKNDVIEFIQDALLDGVWYMDVVNHENQWFSPKFWNVLGYRAVEVRYNNEDLNSIIHPDDYKILQLAIEKNLKNPKRKLRQIIRFIHKDESIVWFNCTGKILLSEDKNPFRIIILLQKIMDFKNLEEKFLKVEKTLYQTNSVAKIGHWELDVIKNELTWSENCRSIFEVTDNFVPDIFNGIGFYKEGENRDRITRIMDNCLKKGISWDEELQIVTAKESPKWVRVVGEASVEDGVCVKIHGIIQDIDLQKRETIALELSQNQFKLVFDHAKVGMCMLDFEGNFLEVNESLCQILGYTRKELLLINDSKITHPNYIEICCQKVQELVSGAIDSYQLDKRYLHKNGETVWVTISAAVVRNSKNEAQFIIKEVQDITEQKNAELELQKSEIKFKNIVENVNDVIFVINLEGNFSYLSPNIEENTGFKVSELVGNPLQKIVHPEYIDFSLGALLKVVSTRTKQLSDDFVILHKNGSNRWYQANGTPLMDDNDNVYAVLGVAREVTEYRQAQEDLVKSEAEAIEITKHYKSLLDNDSVYIIKIDLNGNYSFVNNHFCNQFGFDQSVIGTSAMQGIIEEDQAICKETVMKCFMEPEISHQVVLRKIMTDKAIGGSKWEFKGILDDAGNVKEILCVGIDITKEVRSLENSKQLLTLSSKQNVQLKSFNYIVSHDIRSHAANITALIEIIPTITDSEEKNEIFEMLNLSSSKLNETLNNLNQIICINEEILQQYTEVNLLDEINKTLEIFSFQIKELDVQFEIDVDIALTLNIIHAYLDSILLNLISNAIKYRLVNRQLIITIKAQKNTNGIQITIGDNGRGFDFEKNKDKVFGMYKTFHSGEDSKGFGLFITKSQVEAMGGNIAVQSKPEIGTLFTINLNE